MLRHAVQLCWLIEQFLYLRYFRQPQEAIFPFQPFRFHCLLLAFEVLPFALPFCAGVCSGEELGTCDALFPAMPCLSLGEIIGYCDGNMMCDISSSA